MYQKIQEALGPDADIEMYKEDYRLLYFEEPVFRVKKSREMLEKSLQQEFNPEIKCTDAIESVIKNFAKIYLI